MVSLMRLILEDVSIAMVRSVVQNLEQVQYFLKAHPSTGKGRKNGGGV